MNTPLESKMHYNISDVTRNMQILKCILTLATITYYKKYNEL